MHEKPAMSASGRWVGRAVLHVDMDAFFASVEQLDHPEWRGLPVVVGGRASDRGVVAAASYEARRYGVRSAMPSATAQRLCPDAIWAPPRFDRYRELSSAVLTLFQDVTPHVQQVSIDEAYLDVTPGESGDDPVSIARSLRDAVDGMGLSCSIGLATSKTVAKIASDLRKPHGLVIVRCGEEAEFLAPLPVRALPGIGGVSTERLKGLGVKTLGGLAALDPATAHALLGSSATEAQRRAAGIDERPVRASQARKSLSKEKTFSTDLSSAREVEDAVRRLAEGVGRRLRKESVAGRTVTVKLRYSDFTTKTVRRTLEAPVQTERELAGVALALLKGSWSPGVGLRLIGVGVSGFSGTAEQLGLFPAEGIPAGREGPHRAVAGLDMVRERFGERAIGLGREGLRQTDEEREGRGERPKEGSDGGDGHEEG